MADSTSVVSVHHSAGTLAARTSVRMARLLLVPWQPPYIFVYIGPGDSFSFSLA